MIVFFLVSFAIYLYTLFPSIAPYRDAGEMVTVVQTLGVAHPPGYPLYVLLGRVFVSVMPFGDAAYRLNVFSSLAGALTVLPQVPDRGGETP